MGNNVLILATDLHGGGAEYVARLMAESFLGCTCVIFEDKQPEEPISYQIRTIPSSSSQNLLVRLAQNCFRVLFIQWVKICCRPKVTISHLEGPNFANLLTMGRDKRIIFVHNSIRDNYSRNKIPDALKKYLIRKLYPRAHCIVGVSTKVCEEVEIDYSVNPKHITYIPNPVDNTQIREMSKESFGDWRDELMEMKYLISVANFIEQKNHTLLINVYDKLLDIDPNLKLLLLGRGDTEAIIQELCISRGLAIFDSKKQIDTRSPQVYFLGFQTNPYPFVANSQLFVMTSLWEGLPIAMLEAMSLGKPLVVSDCSPTISELMRMEGPGSTWGIRSNHGYETTPCGYLMNKFSPPNDPSVISAWVKAASSLLGDHVYHDTCSNNVKLKVNDYDIGKINKIWQEIVHQQAAGRNLPTISGAG